MNLSTQGVVVHCINGVTAQAVCVYMYMHVAVLELIKNSHVHNKQNHAQSTKDTRTHCTSRATVVYIDHR